MHCLLKIKVKRQKLGLVLNNWMFTFLSMRKHYVKLESKLEDVSTFKVQSRGSNKEIEAKHLECRFSVFT